MKNILLFSFIIAFVFSQEEIPVDTLYMKMDTLLINQGQMLKNQEKLLDEVIYIDPLEGKKFGIEVNPVGLLLSTINSDGLTLRAGVSFFPSSSHGEIAFPIYYRQQTSENIFSETLNSTETVFQIDGQYRGFIGKHRKGFYFSSGLRYRYKDTSYSSTTLSDSNSTTNDIGLTFGIGFRLYGLTGWYWGTSLYGGRYLTEEDAILEIELLKFGRLF